MARSKPVFRIVHTTGMEDISAVLREFPAKMRATMLAGAVSAGAVPLEVAAKRFARRSERTGQLRDSITTIVRKYEDTGTAVAIVGPVVEGWHRGVNTIGGKYVKKRKGTKGVTTPAVKYAHLVEFGHRIVTGGSLRPQYSRVLSTVVNSKGKAVKRWRRGAIIAAAKGKESGWVPAKPFLRPAFATTGPAVLAEMHKGLSVAMEKLRSKMIKTGTHVA